MARLLLVHGGHPGGRTARLVAAVSEGARDAAPDTELSIRPALLADANDLRGAQGLLLGTPEHFGYMSGALKDFFDRTYYPVGEATVGLPFALFVSAGNDGTGTCRAVERIATGYRWREVAPPLIVIGDPDAAGLARCRELGATLAAGLAAGIW